MKTIQKYVADDGKEFVSKEECELYEKDADAHALVGLTAEVMTDMLDGGYADIGLCVERVGRRLARKRQEREEALRKPRNGENGDGH